MALGLRRGYEKKGMAKTISLTLTSSVRATSHVGAATMREGDIVGYSESDGRPQVAFADQAHDGLISHGVAGKPSSGEDGAQQVCRNLVAVLNSQGDDWDDPVGPERSSYFDCASVARCDPKRSLKIQVTRATVDPSLWRALSVDGGSVEHNVPPMSLARELHDAIAKKAGGLPLSSRRGVVLALDAVNTPAHALDDVVRHFRSSFGTQVKTLGFESIWVVGPSTKMVNRLDLAE